MRSPRSRVEAVSASGRHLLVVSPTFPYPLVSGGKQRIYHLLQELARTYRITLLSLAEPEDRVSEGALDFLEDIVLVPIRQSRHDQILRLGANFPAWLLGTPAEVLVKRSRGLRRALWRLLETGRFAAVQIEYSQLLGLVPCVRSAGIPVIAVAHDVSFVSQRRKADLASGIGRIFWQREARLMREFECRGWRGADQVIAMSEIDRRMIRDLVPGVDCEVVPNGTRLPQQLESHKTAQPTLIFVGWMRHLPNRDALGWFLREIWPRIREHSSDIVFRIVGKGLSRDLMAITSRDPRVEYLGYVDRIESLVASAWISVVPIRIGSGSRLKILESMGLGTPVVTTTVGCEGIDAVPERDALFADQAGEFAKQTLRLVNDAQLRQALQTSGWNLIREHYSWERIGERAAQVIGRVIVDYPKRTARCSVP